MSSRDRLSRLTADLMMPPADAASGRPLPSDAGQKDDAASSGAPGVESSFPAIERRPPGRRTGPGELLAFRGEMLAAESEVARLRERLQLHESSLPTKKLDPARVRPSRWANRHPSTFATPEFASFKADIESAGGNVQPILVRPMEDAKDEFELVFGHRRHRACLELGLPVMATIVDAPMSDLDVFAAMDRENRGRADLSPWEQGTMYRRAMDDGMFPSVRRLAETLSVSHTWVRMALAVADVPPSIIECFRSPLELQARHATEINAALQSDRKAVLRRAEKLAQSPQKLAASAVVEALLGKARAEARTSREVRIASKVAGRVTWDARGQAVIRLLPGVLHAANVDAVVTAIGQALQAAGDTPEK